MILKTLSIWASFGLILLANEVNTMNELSSHREFRENYLDETSQKSAEVTIISEFDLLFKEISNQEGNDWRLMSAIAYHESRFKPEVSSPVGATGLMQVMPRTAEQFGISREELWDVETNITHIYTRRLSFNLLSVHFGVFNQSLVVAISGSTDPR